MANLMPGNDPMQVVAAAVTPVVLISATAILVSGVNSRYMSISDKMRSLAHEWREAATSAERKALIADQMKTFRERISLVAWAVRLLYAAVACFASMALVISATMWRRVLEFVTLPMFVVGISLMLGAILLQLIELQLANRTISTEVRDITTD
jgi:TRAP-type C4-dicarboxylate transport system permease small subunit